MGVCQVALDPGDVEEVTGLPGELQGFFEPGDTAPGIVLEPLDEGDAEVQGNELPGLRRLAMEVEAPLEIIPCPAQVTAVKE